MDARRRKSKARRVGAMRAQARYTSHYGLPSGKPDGANRACAYLGMFYLSLSDIVWRNQTSRPGSYSTPHDSHLGMVVLSSLFLFIGLRPRLALERWMQTVALLAGWAGIVYLRWLTLDDVFVPAPLAALRVLVLLPTLGALYGVVRSEPSSAAAAANAGTRPL